MCLSTGVPTCQIHSGLLFGLPLAATSFNRVSRFTVWCQLVYAVTYFYFDEAHITD